MIQKRIFRFQISDFKFLFLISLFHFICYTSVAQQDPQFSLFSLNPVAYNPAVTGINKSLNISLQGRTQWVNITGNPQAQFFNINSYASPLHGGIGLEVMNNLQGVQRNTFIGAEYSYLIEGRKSRFAIGAKGGIIQSGLDGSKLRSPDGFYYENTINHNDNILPNSSVTAIAPDFSAGVLFNTKTVTAGISASHLFEPSIHFKNSMGNLGIDVSRNYFGYLSFDIGMKNSVAFKPSVLFKSNLTEYQAEASFLAQFKKLFWAGVGYRGLSNTENDALIGIIGLNLNENLSVCYSYDYTLSSLNKVSNGSHEALLSYKLNLYRQAKPGKVIFTPRF